MIAMAFLQKKQSGITSNLCQAQFVRSPPKRGGREAAVVLSTQAAAKKGSLEVSGSTVWREPAGSVDSPLSDTCPEPSQRRRSDEESDYSAHHDLQSSEAAFVHYFGKEHSTRAGRRRDAGVSRHS